MATFLAEIKGFTPVIDVVVKDAGLIEAAVYGVVWRYCQMNDGVCNASIETLAEHTGLSTRTIMRHLERLEETGYIQDTTPDLRNRPHVYRDVGKVKILGMVEAGMTESHTSDGGMTESHSRYDRESHPGMTESHLKKHDTIEENIQETFVETESVSGNAHFVALAKVCKIDLAMATKTQKNQIGQSAKVFKAAGETPDRINNFGVWWYENDWRGKKRQPPTPAQVREEWGKFKESAQYNGASIQAFAAR